MSGMFRHVLISAAMVVFAIPPTYAQIDVTKRAIDTGLTGAYWVYVYDINKDNRLDLVAGSGSKGVRWYRNNNNKTFTMNGVEGDFFGIWTVSAFDIDSDGDVDIAASSTALDIVAWWERTSSGYVKHVADNISQDPESFFVADLDGDGDGDFLVGGWESNEMIWVENQDTAFVRHILDASFKNVHSVYAAHLNNDSRIDIVASGSNKTLYWINNGSGAFTKRTFDNIGAWSIFPVDLDSDGRIDVVRSNRITRGIEWFRNKGDGNFSAANIIDTQFAAGMSPAPDTTEIWSVAAGDLDGDGDTDVVAALYPKFNPNSNGYVCAWLNDGNQQFTEFVVDSLVKGPRSVAVGDFDRDGDNDIAAAANTGVVWYELQMSVLPTLTLLAPNGGENVTGGSSFTLQWNSTGAIDTVKIEYSLDGGSTWMVIASSAANTGSFAWNVPDVQTSAALVRISKADNSSIFDTSNAAFTITGSSITLLSPNGGEIWVGGSPQPITWSSSGAISAIKLEFSLNNGQSWSPIINSTENDGAFQWTLPKVNSTAALLRISDASDGVPADVSNSTFSINTETLTLLAPNGGEVWTAGSNQLISWNFAGGIAAVKIEYSLNGGVSWTTIVGAANNTGSYNWSVPSANSTAALVRISDASDGHPSDVSDAVFTIQAPASLTLIKPNGGETWRAGGLHQIDWSSTGVIVNVKLEYSLNDGGSWTTITAGANNDGSYTWNLPQVESASARVRVSDASNSAIFDVSDGVFTIAVEPTLKVNFPNGGENWPAGSEQEIRWVAFPGLTQVKLEYSIDNGASWNIIKDNTPNDGVYGWTVPEAETNQALVRISDFNNPAVFDVSDGVFSILASQSLTLTSPNGGETWIGGADHSITWISSGSIPSVKLEYSLNNGASWSTIANSIPNNGSYSWVVPDFNTTAALVRISDASDGAPQDLCDAIFTIVVSSLTLTSPNGGEIWSGASTRSILWNSTGVITAVKLEYSINNGKSWTTIAAAAPNNSNFAWQVPNVQTDSALVRITDVNNSSRFDISNGVFKIQQSAGLTIVTPNGGEVFEGGTNVFILWNSNNVSSVTLEYTLDMGNSWTVIAGNIVNVGSYLWNVPNAPTLSGRIRVSNATNSGVPSDMSDGFFTIQANPTSVTEHGGAIPERFELSQNYPNPFNLGTKIDFAAPKKSHVLLEIFNIKGERIRTLYSGEMGVGRYTAFWDGLNDAGEVAASGLYIYKIRIGEWQASRTLTLLK